MKVLAKYHGKYSPGCNKEVDSDWCLRKWLDSYPSAPLKALASLCQDLQIDRDTGRRSDASVGS